MDLPSVFARAARSLLGYGKVKTHCGEFAETLTTKLNESIKEINENCKIINLPSLSSAFGYDHSEQFLRLERTLTMTMHEGREIENGPTLTTEKGLGRLTVEKDNIVFQPSPSLHTRKKAPSEERPQTHKFKTEQSAYQYLE